jgi:endonuclease/exonuclease/phosphatase family metal-dependent hydrolase
LGVIYGYGSVFTDIEGFGESQNNINTRMWSVDVFANENFSFVLTGLHLKAGGNEKDRATRTGQINFLKEQYQRFLKLNPKTKIALVGDLNCTPDSEEFKKILVGKKNEQFIDPIANDAIFSHPADKPSRRIDHILLNPELKKSQVPNSAQIVNSLGGEKMRSISDHLPVMMQFMVK